MNAKRRTSRRRRGVALAISALSALLLPLTAMPAAALTDPTPDTTVIRVNIADVRVSAGLTPSDIDSRYTEGQTLLLAADESGAEPLGDAWASCVTDADGICEFVVPDTQSGGANAGITPWIVFGDPVPGSAAALNTYVVDSFYTSNRTGQRGQIPYSVQVPAGTVTGGAIVDLPEAVDPALDTGLTQRDTFGNLGLSLNNPDLTDQCRPLQVAIVFDLSSSIGEANLPLVKEAGRALVDGLVGSGSSVALYTFSRYAPSNNTTNHALTPVDAPGGRDELVPDIESYVTSSGTNWDRGIAQVAEDAPDYDIAFVLTDGLPDKSGFPYMPASSTFPQRFAEVDQGRFSANELKAEGTRVFGIGINLDDATSVPSQPESSIQAISGPNEYPEYPVTQADYAGVDWDRLVSLTSELIDEIVCRTDVTVHKTQIDREGVSSPGEGWHFDIASSNADAVIDPADGVTTDDTGTATADITTTGTAATDVTITETPQPGWELADVTCTVDGEPIAVDVAEQVTLPQVSPESHAECFFTNQDIRVESTLTVHKVEAAGTGDRPGAGWSFDATATGEGVQIDPTGALVTDGEGSATAVIASPDTPFDLELTEAPQDGWTFADVSCTVDGAPVAVDSAETVSLSDVPAGSNIDCVFVNTEDPLSSTLTIEKIELLDGVRVPGGGWTFDLDAEGAEFAAGDSLTTGDDGMASTVVTAPNRPYELTISEQDEAGWTLDSVTCTVAGAAVDVDQTATITLSGVAAGADVHCTFVNTDDPEVPGVPEGPDDNEDGGADPGQGPDDDAQGELGVTGAEPAIGAALLGIALLLGGAAIVTARRRHS